MVAGATGGAFFWTIMFPVDVAKSRIQINKNEAGLLTTIIKMAKTEGVSSLYNGLKPTVVRTIPATAALFATYEYSKKFMHSFYD